MRNKIETGLVMVIILVVGFFAGFLTRPTPPGDAHIVVKHVGDLAPMDKEMATAEREIKAMLRASVIGTPAPQLTEDQKNELFKFWCKKHEKYKEHFDKWQEEVAVDVDLEVGIYSAQKMKETVPALEKIGADLDRQASESD